MSTWKTPVEYQLVTSETTGLEVLFFAAQESGNRFVFLRLGTGVLIVSIDPSATHPGVLTSYLSCLLNEQFTGEETAPLLLDFLIRNSLIASTEDFDAGTVSGYVGDKFITGNSGYFRDVLDRGGQEEIRGQTELLLAVSW